MFSLKDDQTDTRYPCYNIRREKWPLFCRPPVCFWLMCWRSLGIIRILDKQITEDFGLLLKALRSCHEVLSVSRYYCWIGAEKKKLLLQLQFKTHILVMTNQPIWCHTWLYSAFNPPAGYHLRRGDQRAREATYYKKLFNHCGFVGLTPLCTTETYSCVQTDHSDCGTQIKCDNIKFVTMFPS